MIRRVSIAIAALFVLGACEIPTVPYAAVGDAAWTAQLERDVEDAARIATIRTADKQRAIMRGLDDVAKLFPRSTSDAGYAFVHHKLVGLKAPTGGGGPPPWSNNYSCRYTGTVTADAGRTNLFQPSAWARTLTSQEIAIVGWAKRNGRDGTIIGSRTSSNGYLWLSVSGTTLSATFGGNFASGCTIADNVWFSFVITVRNESGTYVGRVFINGAGSSCINTNAGSDTLSNDFFTNIRSDALSGSWASHNVDELAVFQSGFTVTHAQEWYNGGTAMDATTHTQAASLVSHYRCGDDAGDTSSTLNDVVGIYDGTHVNTSNVSYPAVVP